MEEGGREGEGKAGVEEREMRSREGRERTRGGSRGKKRGSNNTK